MPLRGEGRGTEGAPAPARVAGRGAAVRGSPSEQLGEDQLVARARAVGERRGGQARSEACGVRPRRGGEEGEPEGAAAACGEGERPNRRPAAASVVLVASQESRRVERAARRAAGQHNLSPATRAAERDHQRRDATLRRRELVRHQVGVERDGAQSRGRPARRPDGALEAEQGRREGREGGVGTRRAAERRVSQREGTAVPRAAPELDTRPGGGRRRPPPAALGGVVEPAQRVHVLQRRLRLCEALLEPPRALEDEGDAAARPRAAEGRFEADAAARPLADDRVLPRGLAVRVHVADVAVADDEGGARVRLSHAPKGEEARRADRDDRGREAPLALALPRVRVEPHAGAAVRIVVRKHRAVVPPERARHRVAHGRHAAAQLAGGGHRLAGVLEGEARVREPARAPVLEHHLLRRHCRSRRDRVASQRQLRRHRRHSGSRVVAVAVPAQRLGDCADVHTEGRLEGKSRDRGRHGHAERLAGPLCRGGDVRSKDQPRAVERRSERGCGGTHRRRVPRRKDHCERPDRGAAQRVGERGVRRRKGSDRALQPPVGSQSRAICLRLRIERDQQREVLQRSHGVGRSGWLLARRDGRVGEEHECRVGRPRALQLAGERRGLLSRAPLFP
mmetsp:Transcript_36086/g.115515  ORF Transcript_36086/g.115515 Transcript_36086/m.115515 type:complete len:623 (+) Transcript_36086:68-1936(+)